MVCVSIPQIKNRTNCIKKYSCASSAKRFNRFSFVTQKKINHFSGFSLQKKNMTTTQSKKGKKNVLQQTNEEKNKYLNVWFQM